MTLSPSRETEHRRMLAMKAKTNIAAKLAAHSPLRRCTLARHRRDPNWRFVSGVSPSSRSLIHSSVCSSAQCRGESLMTESDGNSVDGALATLVVTIMAHTLAMMRLVIKAIMATMLLKTTMAASTSTTTSDTAITPPILVATVRRMATKSTTAIGLIDRLFLPIYLVEMVACKCPSSASATELPCCNIKD